MDVTIEVTEGVRIVGSKLDWCVESRRVSETTGKERWDFCGSFASPTQALQSMVNGRNAALLLREPGDPPELALSLPQFVERIERASRVVAVVAKRAAASKP